MPASVRRLAGERERTAIAGLFFRADHPRAIDRIIDYFGEGRPTAWRRFEREGGAAGVWLAGCRRKNESRGALTDAGGSGPLNSASGAKPEGEEGAEANARECKRVRVQDDIPLITRRTA